jgi:hypothetical protein
LPLAFMQRGVMFYREFPTSLDEYFSIIQKEWGVGPVSAFPIDEPFYFKAGKKIFTRLHPDQAVKRYSSASWQDLKDLYEAQLSRSLKAEKENNQEAHFFNVCGQKVGSRSFGQLPCTVKSIQLRVKLISEHISKDKPILIIGDDDALSLALAAAGFTDITVLEIDKKIIAGLAQALKNYPECKVQLIQHDIFRPLNEKAIRDYAMVSFDPWYTMDGLQVFFSSALKASLKKPSVLLSFNCGALLRDYPMIKSYFAQEGFVISGWMPLANTYPVPGELRYPLGVMEVMQSLIFKCKLAAKRIRKGPSFFSSDILWLTPKADNENN